MLQKDYDYKELFFDSLLSLGETGEVPGGRTSYMNPCVHAYMHACMHKCLPYVCT